MDRTADTEAVTTVLTTPDGLTVRPARDDAFEAAGLVVRDAYVTDDFASGGGYLDPLADARSRSQARDRRRRRGA